MNNESLLFINIYHADHINDIRDEYNGVEKQFSVPVYKKERQQHSHAFPADLNTGFVFILLLCSSYIAVYCSLR